MKYILLLLISTNLLAKTVQGNFSYKSFAEAEGANNQLEFIVESTKVGIFSSDVNGYVKSFSYSADYNAKSSLMKNMKIIFETAQMDTDGEDRDFKLHNLCMEVKKYPKLEILVPKILFIKNVREQNLEGIAKIRGKDKKIKINIKVTQGANILRVTGSSVWSLKEMEIPDPSIAVATLSDEIRVNFKFDIPL